MPITPPIELISTIRPARWARIAGRTRCTTRTLPQKLVSSCALASCTDEHSAAPARPQPAAATTASSRPAASSTAATPERTDSSSSTSIARPAQPPDDVPRLLAPVTVQPAACSRSAQARPGPAGQSVNTGDTRAELSFDLAASTALPPALKQRALAALEGRLTDGVITLAASEHRSQLRNREAAAARLAELLTEATAPPPKARRPTKPSRGAVQRRLADKQRRSQTKRLRRSAEDQ